MEYALGHYLDLYGKTGGIRYKFQNFYIDQQVDNRGFLPFGFSGTTTNRQGDNLEATLTFPNNELSRSWAAEALENSWGAQVYVFLMDPDNPAERRLLYEYYGQITSGGWDETSLNLKLSTVLDSVLGNIPVRVMHRKLVGKLPTSSSLGL